MSLWLAPSGVNGASSKLCPAHLRHVATAISDFLLFVELHFEIIHEGYMAGKPDIAVTPAPVRMTPISDTTPLVLRLPACLKRSSRPKAAIPSLRKLALFRRY